MDKKESFLFFVLYYFYKEFSCCKLDSYVDLYVMIQIHLLIKSCFSGYRGRWGKEFTRDSI